MHGPLNIKKSHSTNLLQFLLQLHCSVLLHVENLLALHLPKLLLCIHSRFILLCEHVYILYEATECFVTEVPPQTLNTQITLLLLIIFIKTQAE